VEFWGLAGGEVLLQIIQVLAQDAVYLAGQGGVGDNGLNGGIFENLTDICLPVDHFQQRLIVGQGLELRTLAQGQKGRIVRDAAFQQWIVQHKVGNVAGLVNLPGRWIISRQDPVQFEVMQFAARFGQELRGRRIVPFRSGFGREIAANINRNHEEEKINSAVEQPDAKAKPAIKAFPANDLFFVRLVLKMKAESAMRRAARNHENDQNNQEGQHLGNE